jgi:hypothetical protein
LVENSGLNAVKGGQIAIENDLFASDEKHQLRNVFWLQDKGWGHVQ